MTCYDGLNFSCRRTFSTWVCGGGGAEALVEQVLGRGPCNPAVLAVTTQLGHPLTRD